MKYSAFDIYLYFVLKCLEKIPHKLVHDLHLLHLHVLQFFQGRGNAFSLGYDHIVSTFEALSQFSVGIFWFSLPLPGRTSLSLQAEFM